MMQNRKGVIIGAVAVSLSAILWGLDGVVLTPRLKSASGAYLDIGYVVFLLHAIPFIIMNCFLYKQYRQLKVFTRQDVVYFLMIALFGGALGTLSIVKALFLVNFKHLTIVVLLQKLQPLFAISLAAILLKERLNRRFVLWGAVAIVASYFLTFGWHWPDLETGANTVYAALLAVLAAFSFGSSTVFSKKILLKYSFTTSTFYRYLFTSLLMLLYVAASGTYQQWSVTPPQTWGLLLLIAFTTGSGAIFLYYYGLTRVRAMVATVCELFFPLSAIVFDYLFNGNQLSWIQWLSAGVMIFAIIRLNIGGQGPVRAPGSKTVKA